VRKECKKSLILTTFNFSLKEKKERRRKGVRLGFYNVPINKKYRGGRKHE
jgi:hypothetical protein